MLVALTVVAVVTVGATVALGPSWPTLPREALKTLARDRLLVALSAVVLLELVYLAALAIFTAPVERDALGYHLARALFWIQNEHVGYIDDTLDARINEFPVNAEILQGATMLLSGSMRWVGLVQLTALLGAMLAIFGIARRTGASIRQAAFGALLFATLPVVMLQAPSALNDLMVASLVATAAFFVLGRTRAEVGLAALATALLVGTKGTGLLALPVLFALAVSVKRGRQLASIVTAGAAGVLVGAAWYLNNLAKTDSLFGTVGESHRGSTDAVAVAARATRYAVELFEVPGAAGRDRFLYVVGAIALVTGRARIAKTQGLRGRLGGRPLPARRTAARGRPAQGVLEGMESRRIRAGVAAGHRQGPDDGIECPFLVRPCRPSRHGPRAGARGAGGTTALDAALPRSFWPRRRSRSSSWFR